MIRVYCRDFTGHRSHLNHQHEVSLPRLALHWAAITVGKPGWRQALLTGGIRRVHEILGICHQHEAYLEWQTVGLCCAPLYWQLEPTEKGMASFRIGMTLAKLVAARILGTPYLTHLASLLNDGTATLTSGKSKRGDLAGPDRDGQWHVVEAKGRSNPPGSEVAAGAKAQARAVRIHGTDPATQCSSVADLSESPIMVDFADPESGPEGEPLEVRLDLNSFMRGYYGLVVHLLAAGATFRRASVDEVKGSPTYMVTDLAISEVTLGIEEGIYALISDPSRSSESLWEYVSQNADRYLDYERASAGSERRYLAADGLMVEQRHK